jgi:hypothetical protein
LERIRLITISSRRPNDSSYLLQTNLGTVITDAKVYAFTEGGPYTGSHSSTDFSGTAYFDSDDFSSGNYRFRVDYRGYRFWSDLLPFSGPFSHTHIIPHSEIRFSATQTYLGEATTLAGLKTYLFSAQGAYLGISKTTDSSGQSIFVLPDMNYKIRLGRLGQFS